MVFEILEAVLELNEDKVVSIAAIEESHGDCLLFLQRQARFDPRKNVRDPFTLLVLGVDWVSAFDQMVLAKLSMEPLPYHGFVAVAFLLPHVFS